MIKLNLGCGEDIKPGYINTDISTNCKADKHFDLGVIPYPFPDNYADEILMISSLEHVRDTDRVMAELYRILKPGGIIIIHVPYAKSDGAFQCPEHKSYYTEKSFDYVCNAAAYPSYTGPTFERVSTRLTVVNNTWRTKIRNLIPFRGILRHFLWNMFDEVQFVLRKL